MRYIPVAGTGGWQATWIHEDSDFGRMMTAAGCASVRTGNRLFRWDGAIDGIDGDNATWESYAEALFYFSRDLRYEDLNYICHSHAGQIALLLAASGFKLRSLTTVGTPIRPEIDLAKAEDNIGFHQHIIDDRFDVIGFLGSWRLGRFDLLRKRSMPDPRVRNIPVRGISHSKVLTEREHISKWITEGWLSSMVSAPGAVTV
jgi:hypothetical protein